MAVMSENRTRILAGKVEDFPLNEVKVVETQRGSIGVVRTDSGYFGIANRCPHRGAPLCADGTVRHSLAAAGPFAYQRICEHRVVVCPWHRWEFRIDSGESVGQVTNRRVPVYDVREEEGLVFIEGMRSRAAGKEAAQ